MADTPGPGCADDRTVEVSRLVGASLERVWALTTDVRLAARFSSELRDACWLDEPPAVGARIRGRSSHPARGHWETVSHVTRYEPPHTFAWNVGDVKAPSASWWYELEPDADGVLVRHGVRIGTAPSGLTRAIEAAPHQASRIIERRLRELERDMTATLHGLKTLAEAP